MADSLTQSFIVKAVEKKTGKPAFDIRRVEESLARRAAAPPPKEEVSDPKKFLLAGNIVTAVARGDIAAARRLYIKAPAEVKSIVKGQVDVQRQILRRVPVSAPRPAAPSMFIWKPTPGGAPLTDDEIRWQKAAAQKASPKDFLRAGSIVTAAARGDVASAKRLLARAPAPVKALVRTQPQQALRIATRSQKARVEAVRQANVALMARQKQLRESPVHKFWEYKVRPSAKIVGTGIGRVGRRGGETLYDITQAATRLQPYKIATVTPRGGVRIGLTKARGLPYRPRTREAFGVGGEELAKAGVYATPLWGLGGFADIGQARTPEEAALTVAPMVLIQAGIKVVPKGAKLLNIKLDERIGRGLTKVTSRVRMPDGKLKTVSKTVPTSKIAKAGAKAITFGEKYAVPTAMVGLTATSVGPVYESYKATGFGPETKELTRQWRADLGGAIIGGKIGAALGERLESRIAQKIWKKEAVAGLVGTKTITNKGVTATINKKEAERFVDRIFDEMRGKIPGKLENTPIHLAEALKGKPVAQKATREIIKKFNEKGVYQASSLTSFTVKGVKPTRALGDIDFIKVNKATSNKELAAIVKSVTKKHGLSKKVTNLTATKKGLESGLEGKHWLSVHSDDAIRANLNRVDDTTELFMRAFARTKGGEIVIDPRVEWRMKLIGGLEDFRAKDIIDLKAIYKGTTRLVKQPTGLQRFLGTEVGTIYGPPKVKLPRAYAAPRVGKQKLFGVLPPSYKPIAFKAPTYKPSKALGVRLKPSVIKAPKVTAYKPPKVTAKLPKITSPLAGYKPLKIRVKTPKLTIPTYKPSARPPKPQLYKLPPISKRGPEYKFPVTKPAIYKRPVGALSPIPYGLFAKTKRAKEPPYKPPVYRPPEEEPPYFPKPRRPKDPDYPFYKPPKKPPKYKPPKRPPYQPTIPKSIYTMPKLPEFRTIATTPVLRFPRRIIEEEELTSGFKVLVREKGERIGRKWKPGEFKPLTKPGVVLPRQLALALGQKHVRAKAARTFKIEPAFGRLETTRGLRGFRPEMFTQKGRVFTERTKHAIDTYGELQEITRKGIRASQAKMKGSLFGLQKPVKKKRKQKRRKKL